MEKTKNLLWQGKISLRKFGIASTKYGYIFTNKIVIKKNDSDQSETVSEISKKDVQSVEFPSFGAKEVILTGFKGFTVRYKDGSKTKTISFWAKGFGAYPDEKEMQNLMKAMTTYSNKKYEEVANSAESYSLAKYLIAFIPAVVGYFTSGLIGAVVMLFAALTCLYVYNNKNIPGKIKPFIMGAIIGSGCIILVILFFVLGLGLTILSNNSTP